MSPFRSLISTWLLLIIYTQMATKSYTFSSRKVYSANQVQKTNETEDIVTIYRQKTTIKIILTWSHNLCEGLSEFWKNNLKGDPWIINIQFSKTPCFSSLWAFRHIFTIKMQCSLSFFINMGRKPPKIGTNSTKIADSIPFVRNWLLWSCFRSISTHTAAFHLQF